MATQNTEKDNLILVVGSVSGVYWVGGWVSMIERGWDAWLSLVVGRCRQGWVE